MSNQNSPMARWTTNGDTENFVPGDAERPVEKRRFISPLNLFARRKQAFPPVAEAPRLDENDTGGKLPLTAFAADLAAEMVKSPAPADVVAKEDETFGDMQLVELDDDLLPEAETAVEMIDDRDDEVSTELEKALQAATSDDADEPMLLVDRAEVQAPAPAAVAPVAPAVEPAPAQAAAPVVQPAPQPQSQPEPKAVEIATATPERRSSSRVKTTFLGFERSDGRIEDVFEKAREGAGAERSMYPVGWMVIVDGPGRGTSFTLQAGVSQIGRGDDQAVQLNFGDTGISRSNHAAIAYDDEDRKFYLGHGGKSNIVRINSKPVLSTEPLENGDKIRIGETTLVFVAFCGADFNWSLANK